MFSTVFAYFYIDDFIFDLFEYFDDLYEASPTFLIHVPRYDVPQYINRICHGLSITLLCKQTINQHFSFFSARLFYWSSNTFCSVLNWFHFQTICFFNYTAVGLRNSILESWQVQYWSLLNWQNLRLRCGCVTVPVNLFFDIISSCFF